MSCIIVHFLHKISLLLVSLCPCSWILYFDLKKHDFTFKIYFILIFQFYDIIFAIRICIIYSCTFSPVFTRCVFRPFELNLKQIRCSLPYGCIFTKHSNYVCFFLKKKWSWHGKTMSYTQRTDEIFKSLTIICYRYSDCYNLLALYTNETAAC